jgi:hypothetical protein
MLKGGFQGIFDDVILRTKDRVIMDEREHSNVKIIHYLNMTLKMKLQAIM